MICLSCCFISVSCCKSAYTFILINYRVLNICKNITLAAAVNYSAHSLINCDL